VDLVRSKAGHLQATGRDARGRKQYRYHRAWNELRNHDKYDRLIEFARAPPRIRRRTERDLRRRGLSREKILAAIVRLLERTSIRVGNAEYARDNDSFGLTTLRNHHVGVSGARNCFRFHGKAGQLHDFCTCAPRLARVVQNCREIPGQELFKWVDSAGDAHGVESVDVNEHIRSISGQDFTAKDFRTWTGTFNAAVELAALGPCTAPTATKRRLEIKRKMAEATCRVSERLHNRPAACRKYYIHPAIFDAFQQGTLVREMRAAAGQTSASNPRALTPEEATVLNVLERASAARRRARVG
jgi:DNA topoisomerase I